MSDILNQLHEVLEARKGADPDSSYVASLYGKGLNKILEKVVGVGRRTKYTGRVSRASCTIVV